MDRLLEDGLVPPRSLGVDLSERQEKALLKGLSLYPRTRFRSAEEFHTALYEGVGPVPKPGPAPVPTDPTPEPKPEPESEPEPEPAPGAEPETARENLLPVWLKAHKKAAGIGAAALLLVVLIGALAAAGLPRPGPDTDPIQTGSDATGRPGNSADVPTPIYYVYNWDIDQFESLMNDGSVTSIVIREGSNLDINRSMEITKPVQLEPFTNLHISAEVTLSATLSVAETTNLYNNSRFTVAGGGRIEVAGYYGGDGLLRTVDGGTISVFGNGRADFGTLWLERAGDLEADNEHIGLDQRRYIVADEDGLFENAVHVNSFRELENAANDRRTGAIVIDGGFEMEYWLTVNKPVLISEGAVLTARPEQSGFLFGDVAVNRGRVEGELRINDGGVYLNYGNSDVSLNTEGSSCILNLGEFRFRWGTDRYSGIVNLGHMSLETDGNGNNLTILGGIMMNYGDVDLVSGCLEFWANGHLANFGTIRVSANAEISKAGSIWAAECWRCITPDSSTQTTSGMWAASMWTMTERTTARACITGSIWSCWRAPALTWARVCLSAAGWTSAAASPSAAAAH